MRSSEAICPNSAWLARASVTPWITIFWPVSARSRICSAAVSTATSSGTAISARPTSISPLNDLGRPHCMGAFYRAITPRIGLARQATSPYQGSR